MGLGLVPVSFNGEIPTGLLDGTKVEPTQLRTGFTFTGILTVEVYGT